MGTRSSNPSEAPRSDPGTRRTAIPEFISTLDFPGAIADGFIKVASKRIHSHTEAYIKDGIKEGLPATLESLGLGEEWTETIVDNVAPFAGEMAGEIASLISVPLLSAVLKRMKDASVMREVRRASQRMEAGLKRVEQRLVSLDQQLEDRFRMLSEQLATLRTDEFVRAVHVAETALRNPCRNPDECKAQIEDLGKAVDHLLAVEAPLLRDPSALTNRFVVSLLIGLCGQKVPGKKWLAEERLREVATVLNEELKGMETRLRELHGRDDPYFTLPIEFAQKRLGCPIGDVVRDANSALEEYLENIEIPDKYRFKKYENVSILWTCAYKAIMYAGNPYRSKFSAALQSKRWVENIKTYEYLIDVSRWKAGPMVRNFVCHEPTFEHELIEFCAWCEEALAEVVLPNRILQDEHAFYNKVRLLESSVQDSLREIRQKT